MSSLFKKKQPDLKLVPEIPKSSPPPPAPVDPTPWLTLIFTFMGMQELLPDGRVNPKVTEFFEHTTLHTKENEAWCAAIICYLMDETGYQSTRSPGAYEQHLLGTPCELQVGAIVVVEHMTGTLKGKYHVTICSKVIDKAAGKFEGTGGNQGDKVCTQVYSAPAYRIVASRWPVKIQK